jgi:hypothetical protein
MQPSRHLPGDLLRRLQPISGWRMAFAMLLMVAHVMLMNHVVVHQLEDAIHPDNDHCSFCDIGNQATPPALPPPVFPSATYAVVIYLTLVTAYVVGFTLDRVRLRGPPLSVA